MFNLEKSYKNMKIAKKIAKSLKRMENDGFYILLRPNMKVGGVIFDIEQVFTKEGPQRFIHFVSMEDYKPYVEPYEEWDVVEQTFVPNITKFDFVWLTNRVSHLPEAEKIYWLSPSDAEYVEEYKNEAIRLRRTLSEINERSKLLAESVDRYKATIQALNERISNNQAYIEKLSLKNANLESLLIEYEINVRRLISVVNKMLSYYEEEVAHSKEEGKYEAMPAFKKFKTEAIELQEIISTLDSLGKRKETMEKIESAEKVEKVATSEKG